MYCIDCCIHRASAAPLASGSASKSDLLLSHKVLHRSNIILHVVWSHTYSKSKDQPGKVANLARGQLNREN